MARGSDFLNVADAAALLGVHVQTLRRLARQKSIPAFKLGRDWRFRQSALVQWADSQHREEGTRDAACSVLVIDDDAKTCAVLAGMVEGLGCRTRQALSGTAGLDLIAAETPDLVLLDLVMPDMDGPRFLQELRIRHRTLPAVIVTGYPDGELMKDAMLHGPILLVPRPVDGELLERAVRAVVGEKLAPSALRPDGMPTGETHELCARTA